LTGRRPSAATRPTSSTSSSPRSSRPRPKKAAKVIAKGLPAGPGAASGKMYLNADRADAAAAKGEKVLLVRNETTPEDLRGMIASEGILTAKGGVSSHAALVARQMGKVCVCGAGALQIDYAAKTLTADGVTYKEGDFLSINGTLGNVYAGQLPTAASEIVQVLVEKTLDGKKSENLRAVCQLMNWCSKVTQAAGPHQRRHAGADRNASRSARRASA
jgi:pyruvate,orthophosphate dikinase